jgi:hypothetical protein
MKPILLVAVLTLLAAAADATCLRCDQSTSYRCFMSIYGTKMHCDSPSDAGCFTWGACAGGSECDFGCVLNPNGATTLTRDLHVASVTITSPPLPSAQSPAPQHLNG